MDLTAYDLVIVNSSAGKDSQAMLDYLVELADAQDVSRDRLVVVHADLGKAEWTGTGELAQEQAEAYGLRFEVCRRDKGDLLDQVRDRGMWPSSSARYCTSDQKRDQVAKTITALVRELDLDRPARVLNCQGIRAQESSARAKKEPFKYNKRLSGKGTVKQVDDWFPIFDWTAAQVWERIHESGVRYHQAYDLGMPRLSCVFCIFAPKSALMIAGKHNPELLAEYVAIEEEIGHSFRDGFKIAEIQDALDAGETVPEVKLDEIKNWNM